MANAVMTTSSFGSSGLNTIVTLIANQFIAAPRSRVRVLDLVRSVGDPLANGGGTVNVPLAPVVASNLLTDGNAVTLDDTAGTSAVVTLNKHRYVSFGATLMAQALTGNTVSMATEMKARVTGLFNDIEADVMSLATTGFTTNTVGTYNSNVTEANIVLGVGNLFAQKVPQDRELVGLVHPGATAWQALAQISNFATATARGANQPSPILAKAMGYGANVEFQGVNWSMSQSVNKTGTSTDNLIFHPDAICVAFRAFPPPMSKNVDYANFIDSDSRIAFQILISWNKDRIADEITIQTVYGYAVGREGYGCLLKS